MTSPSFLGKMVDRVDNLPTESTLSINTTTAGNVTCQHYDNLIETWFTFDAYQMTKVMITWSLFVLSATGNVFVIISLRSMKRLHHFIMFHLALADLVYACFVLPTDAVWNTTMQWFSGDAGCKFAQMLKQFGMYASSFMVVVIGVDRVTAILNPTTLTRQKKLGIILVSIAWIASAFSTIPAGVVFSILEVPTCEGYVITQCVDNIIVPPNLLQSYHFFSMFASFLLPFFSTIISYSLIVCEISKMKNRDRELMGRRNSLNTASIQKAINKTILMRTLITLTFLLCWGPYYAKGIVDWFIRDITQPEEPGTVYQVSYLLMYFNCFLHPIVFGVFLKEVRENFLSCLRFCFKRKRVERYTEAGPSVASRATNSTGIWQSSKREHNSRGKTKAMTSNDKIVIREVTVTMGRKVHRTDEVQGSLI